MAAPGLFVLRLTLGMVLIAHGALELFGLFGGAAVGPGGLTATAAYFAGIGLTPGLVFAVLAGVLHFGGGLLIIAGSFTRPAALALTLLQLLVLWQDSARWGFFLNWTIDQTRGNGMEYGILTLGALLCLALGGAGGWSIDGMHARSAAARAAGRARVRDRI